MKPNEPCKRWASTSRDVDARPSGVALAVTPPPWRGDVRIPEDVIEEIARVVGYDRIPKRHCRRCFAPRVRATPTVRKQRIAHALVALGYAEIMTHALQPADGCRRATAAPASRCRATSSRSPTRSSDAQRYLRFSLLPGLLAHARPQHGTTQHCTPSNSAASSKAPSRSKFRVGGMARRHAAPRRTSVARRWILVVQRRGAGVASRSLTGVTPKTVTGSMAGWHPGKTATLLHRRQTRRDDRRG